MSEDCIFCKIVKGEIPSVKIYEDEKVLAFLDINPISPGHCLIVPKTHFTRLDHCPESVLQSLICPVGAIARAVCSAVHAPGYNLLNNNGRCAGQLVPHVHFHIIPRRENDGVFHRWPAGIYPPGKIDSLAQEIRQHLLP